MIKKTLEEEINEFLDVWDCKQMVAFFKDIIPILELYDVDDEDDWVKDHVGEDNVRNIRLIRTAYLVSRLAENHSGKLAATKINFRNFWKRMENISV